MAKKKTPNTMGVPRKRAPQRGEGMDLAATRTQSSRKGESKESTPGEEIVKRRHPHWTENNILFRWMLDSYEGGRRYRDAFYGPDRRGLPLRNLIRHKREYPDPQMYPNIYQGFAGFTGSMNPQLGPVGYGPFPGMLGADASATAQDDDYEYRRARTPVPEFVAEAVEIHLGKIYDQEVSRDGPDCLKAWWSDVDNGGTPVDDWIRETVAPLLLVEGTIDVCFDRPAKPPNVEVVTKADEELYGTDKVVASYILPENMLWWDNDPAGNYTECLVQEYINPSRWQIDNEEDREADQQDKDEGRGSESWTRDTIRFRHWKELTVTLYMADGSIAEPERLHGYPCVPIVRLIDLKRHRTPMIGKSRYEAIAEYQREYYNRDSELVLSDTIQAHPLLSGPADLCKGDNTMSVGPGNILPMWHDPASGVHQGWEYVSPPKDPAASLRTNKNDIIDMKDRRASLTKPAGVPGTTGGTVAQSGISKELDSHSGNKVLSSIAKMLARIERKLAEFAMMCSFRRRPTAAERDAIKVTYPARFRLKSSEEILSELQLLLPFLAYTQPDPLVPQAPRQVQGGPAPPDPGPPQVLNPLKPTYACPTLVGELLTAYMYGALIGLDDDEYDLIRLEIRSFLRAGPLQPPGETSADEALEGSGSAEQDAGVDPSGQTGGTEVTNSSPFNIQ